MGQASCILNILGGQLSEHQEEVEIIEISAVCRIELEARMQEWVQQLLNSEIMSSEFSIRHFSVIVS